MQDQTLHALIQQACSGSSQAWESICAQMRPYLLRLTGTFLGVKHPEESKQDLLQDTWSRAWTRIQQFEVRETAEQTEVFFRAWLRQIMLSIHLNDQRHDQADRRQSPGPVVPLQGGSDSSSQGGGAPVDPPAAELTPSMNAFAHERRAAIEEALDRLPDPVDRQIVRLRFFEELSLAEVARRLGRSYDDVRLRLHDSLERLRPQLEGLQ